MCWDQDIPFQPYESWSLAFPKLLSTQIIFPPNPNLWERELSVGETIIWSTRARSSSSTHHLLPFGEWCLLDWLGVTWEPPSRLWSWTKEFVRARRSPTSWRSTQVRQVLRGRWPWWDRQGCFSWTLRGWTLRGLAQLLPFVGWSLHQRGCMIAPPIRTTDKKSSCLQLRLHSSIPSLYILAICMLYSFCCSYSCHAYLKCIVNV